MNVPWYRDFQNAQLPQFQTPEGVAVTVIAGDSHGVQGAVTREITQPVYLDVHMPQGARFEQTLPAGHNAFIYVYRGDVRIGGQAVPVQRMAILKNAPDADGVVIEASTDTRLILVAGKPLKEPIVQYGPFVMNTKEEIYQALADFRDGRLGEKA
jgi:redox-sensitive bicupin YhaK (pirin superfamily)